MELLRTDGGHEITKIHLRADLQRDGDNYRIGDDTLIPSDIVGHTSYSDGPPAIHLVSDAHLIPGLVTDSFGTVCFRVYRLNYLTHAILIPANLVLKIETKKVRNTTWTPRSLE